MCLCVKIILRDRMNKHFIHVWSICSSLPDVSFLWNSTAWRGHKQSFTELPFNLEARTSSWCEQTAPTGAKAVHRRWRSDFPKCQSVYAALHDFSQVLLGFPGMEQSSMELQQAQVPCSERHGSTCRVHIHGDPLLQPLLFATHIHGVAGGLLLQACHWACCSFFCSSAFFWHAEAQGHCATCTCTPSS